jgi:hypothetical protein
LYTETGTHASEEESIDGEDPSYEPEVKTAKSPAGTEAESDSDAEDDIDSDQENSDNRSKRKQDNSNVYL